MSETAGDLEAGTVRQAAPASGRTVELRQPRRLAAVPPAPARNGLPEVKPYVYRGTGYDQYPGAGDGGQ